MSDPTKIRGFRNVSTSHQTVFITEGGEVKISQIGPRRWKVLPRGGEAYEVSGKQEAIEEARGIATGLTPSHLRELQEKQRRLQASLLAEPPKKKSSAQIKREIDEVLTRKASTKERSAAVNALQDLQRDYNALRAVRDATEPSTSEHDSIERQLAGMRRQAKKLINAFDPSATSWKRAFGLVY